MKTIIYMLTVLFIYLSSNNLSAQEAFTVDTKVKGEDNYTQNINTSKGNVVARMKTVYFSALVKSYGSPKRNIVLTYNRDEFENRISTLRQSSAGLLLKNPKHAVGAILRDLEDKYVCLQKLSSVGGEVASVTFQTSGGRLREGTGNLSGYYVLSLYSMDLKSCRFFNK